MPVEALPEVCAELRDDIVKELSVNPGHLASSLGTIELTVALHYVYDTPEDRIVWDVGHQAYGHKILTGRRDVFNTNRKFGGLHPFPTPAESEYDPEPLPLQQSTADPYLSRIYSDTILSQSLCVLWVLVCPRFV